MKKSIAGTMLLIACLFASCQKGANLTPAGAPALGNGGKPTIPAVVPVSVPTDTVTSKLPIGDLISTGTWKVSSYVELLSNGTKKFDGYTFTFSKAGVVTSNQNGVLSNGTWVFTVPNFYYGYIFYPGAPDGFNVYLGTSRPLSLLSKNLFVSKKTTTNIYLKTVNPAEGIEITLAKISK
jgi:hypothetical protein